MTQKNPDHILSDETVASLFELGEVLHGIHKRLISEGWSIDLKNGLFISPDGVQTINGRADANVVQTDA